MLKKILIIACAFVLFGCSSSNKQAANHKASENEKAMLEASSTMPYQLSSIDEYKIRVYAEHINVVLAKFNKPSPIERDVFYDKATQVLKSKIGMVDSSAVIKETFYKWFIDFRFSNGDLQYMSDFVDKTRRNIALKLKRQNAGIDVEQAATQNEMMIDLVHSVADFYYCSKLKDARIEEFAKQCDVILALKGTEKQQRDKVYNQFALKYHKMNE